MSFEFFPSENARHFFLILRISTPFVSFPFCIEINPPYGPHMSLFLIFLPVGILTEHDGNKAKRHFRSNVILVYTMIVFVEVFKLEKGKCAHIFFTELIQLLYTQFF